MEVMLSYVSKMLKQQSRVPLGKELYEGALRIILILHHDFPEFVAENHYRLCEVIPSRCTQLRNLVLSAFPSSIYDLPDPFGSGLKVDRLEDMRKPPILAGDPFQPLDEAGLKESVETLLQGSISRSAVTPLIESLTAAQNDAPSGHGSALGQSLMLYIGHSALSGSGNKPGAPTFDAESPQAQLLTHLIHSASHDLRYHLLGALANQLRFPNSHTHYFSAAVLHLFGSAGAVTDGSADDDSPDDDDVRPPIVRVLLERLIVHRPHPWGLIITLLELLKNSTYAFWDLPFIKSSPEIAGIIQRLVDLGRATSLSA
jgi:CCR4-NOT transcription complex subunit 1